MEKFIFRSFPGSIEAEGALIKLLTDNLDKNSDDLIELFKKKFSSDNLTSHGKIMTRTLNLVVMQFSAYNRSNKDYQSHKLFVFCKESTGEWTLNRYECPMVY